MWYLRIDASRPSRCHPPYSSHIRSSCQTPSLALCCETPCCPRCQQFSLLNRPHSDHSLVASVKIRIVIWRSIAGQFVHGSEVVLITNNKFSSEQRRVFLILWLACKLHPSGTRRNRATDPGAKTIEREVINLTLDIAVIIGTNLVSMQTDGAIVEASTPLEVSALSTAGADTTARGLQEQSPTQVLCDNISKQVIHIRRTSFK